jgi:hypothetical protein
MKAAHSVQLDSEPRGKLGVKNNKPPAKHKIRFSFTHWRQIKNFGLKESTGTVKNAWFVSLLERLREFETLDYSVLTDGDDNYRCHPIDFDRGNVSIAREDLNWLPYSIISSPEEYPIVQFHISKAYGRIIGYIETNVFNIVLLDPLHNLIPHKDNDRKVRHCEELSSELDAVRFALSKGKLPQTTEEFDAYVGTYYKSGTKVLYLDAAHFKDFCSLLESDGLTHFEDSLLMFNDLFKHHKALRDSGDVDSYSI